VDASAVEATSAVTAIHDTARNRNMLRSEDVAGFSSCLMVSERAKGDSGSSRWEGDRARIRERAGHVKPELMIVSR